MADGLDAAFAAITRRLKELEADFQLLRKGEGGGGRKRLTGNLTLYVRSDGNDANDGRADTAARAFLTIAQAVKVAREDYESDTYGITLQVQAGTWNQSSSLILGPHNIYGGVTLRGDPTTPANCIIQGTTDGMWLILGQYAPRAGWQLDGFRIQRGGAATNVNLLLCRWFTLVHFRNVEFGNCGTGAQVYAVEHAIITVNGPYSIVGSGAYHAYSHRGGLIEGDGVTRTITITGSPTFTIFALADEAGKIWTPNYTYSGTVTAKQYESNNSARIKGTYPGGTGGTTANGGTYSA